MNEAATAVGLSTGQIADRVQYPTQRITSDNLLVNPTFANEAQGWAYSGLRGSTPGNSDGTGYFLNDRVYTRRVVANMQQQLSFATAWPDYQPDRDVGGTLAWSLDVSQDDFCSIITWIQSSACADRTTLSVTYSAADGSAGGTDTRTKQERVFASPAFTGSMATTNGVSTASFSFQTEDNSNDFFRAGPGVAGPVLTYSYDHIDDYVLAELEAVDSDENDTHSFALVSDPSGYFAVRGNQLILRAGSAFDASQTASYAMQFEVTDSAGNVATLPVLLRISDAGGVASKIEQNISATEGAIFTKYVDFGQTGASLSAADLPSWITLADLGNGRGRLSGTPPQSGAFDVGVRSTSNGDGTQLDLSFTVADNCTGAYCQRFASSRDSQNLLSANDFTHANLPSWDSFYNEFSSGSGRFQQTATLDNSQNGSWTNQLTVDVDFSRRQLDITSQGHFTGYIDHAGNSTSGSWTSSLQDQTFDGGGDACSAPGVCVFATPISGQVAGIDSRTCTGTSGGCSTDNHPSVAISPEIGLQAKTVTANAAAATHALFGRTAIRDARATTPTAIQAEDSDQQLLVAQ